MSHPCLTSIRTFPQPPPACRGVWEVLFECSNTEKNPFSHFLCYLCTPSFTGSTVLRSRFARQKNYFSLKFCRIFPQSLIGKIDGIFWVFQSPCWQEKYKIPCQLVELLCQIRQTYVHITEITKYHKNGCLNGCNRQERHDEELQKIRRCLQ